MLAQCTMLGDTDADELDSLDPAIAVHRLGGMLADVPADGSEFAPTLPHPPQPLCDDDAKRTEKEGEGEEEGEEDGLDADEAEDDDEEGFEDDDEFEDDDDEFFDGEDDDDEFGGDLDDEDDEDDDF